jgi:hypothetical protein
MFVTFPEAGRFSEIWLLGSDKLINNNSFNVLPYTPYNVFVGVANQMGNFNYYIVYVKMNPNSGYSQNIFNPIQSESQSVYEYRFFLRNNEIWQGDFKFSIEELVLEDNILHVSNLSVNERDIEIDKSIILDDENRFYCQFVFELWIFDTELSDFKYHDRSVWFWISIAQTN